MTVAEPAIFVVSDDGAVRESVVALVETKGLRAKTYSSLDEFWPAFNFEDSGCLILEMNTRGQAGLELLRHVRGRSLGLALIVLSANADIPTAVGAIKAGVEDFLEKPWSDEMLWNAVQQALRKGHSHRESRRLENEAKRLLAALSADELNVYRQLVAGHQNKQISSALGIGLRTVELRRANLLKKMQANSLSELVRLAILGGLSEQAPT